MNRVGISLLYIGYIKKNYIELVIPACKHDSMWSIFEKVSKIILLLDECTKFMPQKRSRATVLERLKLGRTRKKHRFCFQIRDFC